MAEKVGVPTGQTTEAGRPVFKTPEGELISEKSITIPMGGKFINVPSIHDGVRYSEDEIIDMLKGNKIEATSVHDSMEEAIEAAKSRSSKLLAKGGFFNAHASITEPDKSIFVQFNSSNILLFLEPVINIFKFCWNSLGLAME